MQYKLAGVAAAALLSLCPVAEAAIQNIVPGDPAFPNSLGPSTDRLRIDDPLATLGWTQLGASVSGTFGLDPNSTGTPIADAGTFTSRILQTPDGYLAFVIQMSMTTAAREINRLNWNGFGDPEADGFTTGAFWYRDAATADGFAMTSAQRSPFSGPGVLPTLTGPDTLRFQTDLSIPEETPNSAWYGVLTNATNWGYTTMDLYSGSNASFYKGTITVFGPAPVPEPSTYALLAGGLVLLAGIARRRASAS